MFKLVLLALALSLSLNACGQEQPQPLVSTDVSKYPWIRPEFNMVQFYQRSALEHFQKVWQESKKRKVRMVMFGDSHLQGDAYPGQVRKRLQERLGDGGRGLMFAFSTAKTYSSLDYKTSHTGEWQAERAFTMRPKLPMGVRGMTCRTESENASLSFNFEQNVPKEHRLLRIFCKRDYRSYDIIVEAGGAVISMDVDKTLKKDGGLPYIELELPRPIGPDKKLEIRLRKTEDEQEYFEFYGMSLESIDNKGIIVHNAGVGAARSHSTLYCELFVPQMTALEADLVIIDYGTNDYLYDDYIRPELEGEIKRVIDRVRQAAPQASIILNSAQDLYWKGSNCRSGEPFSDLIHRIAKEKNCGVYDWYWVSGAQTTMSKWLGAGLAQPDMIHLGVKGYQLKGDLFADALIATMLRMSGSPDMTEWLYRPSDSLRAEEALVRSRLPKFVAKPTSWGKKNGVRTNPRAAAGPSRVVTPPTAAKPQASTPAPNAAVPAGQKKHLHTIVAGESLYSIAKKHGVTVNQIMAWNGLKHNRINAGKVLVIYKK